MHSNESSMVRFFPITLAALALFWASDAFSIGIPGAIQGPDIDNDGTFTISWGAVSGATRYRIKERGALDSDWYVYGTSWTSNSLPEASYRFRVAACNNNGCGVYTAYHYVTVDYGYVPLDPISVQTDYQYEVRAGDVDANGLTDIHIRRIAGGNLDNGVLAETILRQTTSGQFEVHAASTAQLASARNWSLTAIEPDFADYNLDGYIDLFLGGLGAELGATSLSDQIIISSGITNVREATLVVPWEHEQEMFVRDVRGFLEDPYYFDNAGEPDQPGYRISIDVLIESCFNTSFGVFCIPYVYTIDVGEFSLADLGLDNFLGSATVLHKAAQQAAPAAPSGGVSSTATNKVNQKSSSLMSDYNLSTLIGNDAQRQAALANVTDPSPDPQTLRCVVWCGYIFYWYLDGSYDLVYWVDRWEPITIPGTFDDQNYSRTAFDFSLAFRDTGKILKDTVELPAKNEKLRELILIIAGALGVSVAVEEALNEVYDPESGVPSQVMEKMLEEMINALCTTASAQECMEVVEDLILGDGAYDIGSVEAVLEEIFEPGVLGEVNPEVFDEDWMEENIAIYGTKMKRLRKQPNRRWCAYWMQNPQGRRYFGRTSTLNTSTCDAAVRARWLVHKRKRVFASYLPATPSGEGLGVAGYSAVRGREQALIDWALQQTNQTVLPNLDVSNRIRGVAKRNPLGCGFWLATNTLHGNIAPYTGLTPSSCP